MSLIRISELDSIVNSNGTDLVCVSQDDGDTTFTSKKITVNNAKNNWTQTIGAFNDQAASTSTITMTTDLTSIISVGVPIKFKLSGTYYYAQCVSLTSNLMTIRGAPLTTGDGDLTELWYGIPIMMEHCHISIFGAFEDATSTTLLSTDAKIQVRWQKSTAYCIGFDHVIQIADSGLTQPNVNIRWGGNRISTDNTDAGPLISASWGGTTIDINTTNYAISYQEALEIECTKGTNGDARDLSLDIVMVIA